MNAIENSYEMRANLHKPSDPDAFALEIRRLHSEGLKPRDIANALRLDLAAVLTALRRSFALSKSA
jgi:hypothetical protein